MAATRLLSPIVRPRRRRLPQLLVPVVALAVLVAPAPAGAAAPAAPPLAARLLDEDREFDSRALIGKKVLVLRFQGSWCKTCTAQAPGIQRLAEKYRDRDVEVIGVHVNDTAAEARAWRKRYKQTYGAVLDPGARMATRFGFKLAPYTVLIDKRGEVVKRITGAADEARLIKIIDPLLAKQPSPAH
jgi:thiol-disulfide isomerase/thioredoxin